MAPTCVLSRLAFLEQLAIDPASALSDGERSLGYAELVEAVKVMADWIGQQQASVVAIVADNGINWVVADLACQVAQVVCLPLPDFFSHDQQQHCLAQAGAQLLLADTADVPAATNAQPLGAAPQAHPDLAGLNGWRLSHTAAAASYPQGTGKITFTSGSTGTPKGVCLSNQHQWRVAEALADSIAVKAPRHLCLLPLATLLENIAGVYTPLLCGGTVFVPNGGERGLSGSSGLNLASLTAMISRIQPSTLILIPQLLTALVAACEQGWQPPASLAFVAVGGARVAPELIVRARQLGLPVYEGYGLSECGSVVALNTAAADQPGSVGQVLPHCQVTIADGEIVVQGSTFLGYLGDPASWYPTSIATGDLGAIDHQTGTQQRLMVQGRRKNLLITAFGRNVSPEWIESELTAAPLLTQCVVVGDDRPYLAALVGAPEQVSDRMIADRIAQVNTTLPDYARVQVWQRLPAAQWQSLLTANGRPRRDQIQQQLAATINQLYTREDANPMEGVSP